MSRGCWVVPLQPTALGESQIMDPPSISFVYTIRVLDSRILPWLWEVVCLGLGLFLKNPLEDGGP